MKSRAKKYTPEFRKSVVNYALLTNNTETANVYGITRKTVSKWLDVYKKSGSESFSKRKRREDNQPKKIEDDNIKKIAEAKLKQNYKLLDIKNKFCLDCSLSLISWFSKTKPVTLVE